MPGAIRQLWEGMIEPSETAQRLDIKLKYTLRLTEEQSETLRKSLNEEQRLAFEKYCDCKEEYSLLLSEQAFCDGFRLAMRLAAEALV